MSARAAWRLESLGFRQVYRYTAGKADWSANGLPLEGSRVGETTVADRALRDVPTCRLDERVGDVRERIRRAGWNMCVVVNEANVVLGQVRTEELSASSETLVEQVMQPGPVTYRLDRPAAETARYLAKRKVDSVLVTTSDGVLVGVFYRDRWDDAVPDAQGAGAQSSKVK